MGIWRTRHLTALLALTPALASWSQSPKWMKSSATSKIWGSGPQGSMETCTSQVRDSSGISSPHAVHGEADAILFPRSNAARRSPQGDQGPPQRRLARPRLHGCGRPWPRHPHRQDGRQLRPRQGLGHVCAQVRPLGNAQQLGARGLPASNLRCVVAAASRVPECSACPCGAG